MKSLILLTATIAALCAAEGSEAYTSSLRLSLTGMPNEADVEMTAYNTATNVQASDNVSAEWNDGGSRLSISAFHNNGDAIAFNIGVGVAFTGFSDSSDGVDTTQAEFGVAVEPGIVFNVNPRFALELGIPLGVGVATFKQDDTGSTFEADGTYIECGVVVRPVLKLDRLIAFIELGWVGNYATFDRTAVDGMSNVEVETTVDTTGTFFSLGAGVAF
jgi:hypothetical protein